jgi:hypothetical protein
MVKIMQNEAIRRETFAITYSACAAGTSECHELEDSRAVTSATAAYRIAVGASI